MWRRFAPIKSIRCDKYDYWTVGKKSNICLKKIRAEGFSCKKNPAQAGSEKKKFVQAENSPSSPHHVSNGLSLKDLQGGIRMICFGGTCSWNTMPKATYLVIF